MQHHADVVHHVTGRIRLRLPKGKRDHATLEKVKRSISPMHGVKSVDVNSATGSVVVHYDAKKHDDFHSALARHGEESGLFSLAPPHISEVDELVEAIEKEAEFIAEHSQTARTIVDFVKALNQECKKATDNMVDLQVLLPVGLAVYAFLELEADIATPLWLTLGIFSFNSFITLHQHPPTATETETEETKEPDSKPAKTVRARPRVPQKAHS